MSDPILFEYVPPAQDSRLIQRPADFIPGLWRTSILKAEFNRRRTQEYLCREKSDRDESGKSPWRSECAGGLFVSIPIKGKSFGLWPYKRAR